MEVNFPRNADMEFYGFIQPFMELFDFDFQQIAS